jgi:hypothetical protein
MSEEKCDVPVLFRMTKTERDVLKANAGDRPIAAYIREKLDLQPAAPGRRWPDNPAEREWRRSA